MGWGLDVHWAALAREHGWRCGVIDAVAIAHRAAPAAAGYAREAAIAEARAFLAERPLPERRARPRAPSRPIAAGERRRRPARRPRVAVVAEFYPSVRDPVLGVWAHRQALAARDAGADVRVLVLHRLVPPRASLAAGARGAARALSARAARAARADARRPRGHLRSLRLAAARPLLRALGSVGGARRWRSRCAGCARAFPFDLIHAHNAVPAGDAVRRARAGRAAGRLGARRRRALHRRPRRGRRGGRRARPRRRPAGARQQPRHRRAGALARGRRDARGAPRHRAARARRRGGESRGRERGARRPSLVTVAHLVARKRHADVLRALAVLGAAPPHAALRDHRRRARADRARRPRRRASASPSASTSAASSRRRRRSRRRGAARCS